MNWKTIHKLFGLLVVVGLLAACSPTVPTNNQTPGGSTTVEGVCANDYFPVVQGATWTYKSTGGPAGNYSYTDTVSAVDSNGFTLTSDFGKVTRTQKWSCTDKGLAAMELGGPAVATLNSQDMNFTFDVKKVDGVTLPPQIKTGDGWQHTLDFEGKMEIAKEPATAEGSAQSVFKALGDESVNVPAGTFQATKVQVDTNITFTIKVQGIAVPASYSGSYTYWYAKGVGWVKAQGQGTITGTSFNETIELQKYSIP
jgi:hypothetical protein